ncbi:hypothetical protein O7623_24095 [Solwaraspora sp. WMMD791]|uniref:hypothetical protein n=1 Tax=Solwaraspora sp. WMMD791 TaxID=3016086 RepID=UPI00249BE5A7|nr:hypothetical protein [Solwaraspora sp. WMMD791]WFE26386.1 hypothetical protein O7623_24095 [Solwaraspora sp. WMMD791]
MNEPRSRRRTGPIVAGSAFAALAIAGALALGVSGFGNSAAGQSSDTGGTTSSTTTGGSSTAVQLVAYTGSQPEGYRLATVPQGWVVQGSDAWTLVLAPADAADTDPHSFIGKIAVSTQAQMPTGLPSESVTVDGLAGHLVTMEDNTDGRTLFVEQPGGGYLTVQVWDGLGWSGERIVEFAAGIEVTGDAQQTVG